MYFVILFSCIGLIVGLNLAYEMSLATAGYLLLSFVCVLLPSLVCLVVIRLLPKRLFNWTNKAYFVSKSEQNFYVKMGVKVWKDKIPNCMGKVKNYQAENGEMSAEYLELFLREGCYGEVLHIACVLFGLVGMFLVPIHLVPRMTLPIWVVYSTYNLPSIIIQRYNRPRLTLALKRAKMVEQRKSDKT